ncbi:uncharacterized protein [Watersipora subatra]|uniref:uncharacterized protein n=1 Tax=Watersipora subatra TaxID=2589382 RepID=UPI00355C099E
MDDKLRKEKELFVSNLNGTTWQEIDCLQLMQPLCVILLSSFMSFMCQGVKFPAPHLCITTLRYATDFALSVLPLLAALTVFVEYAAVFAQVLIVCVILLLAVTCNNYRKVSWKDLWNRQMNCDYISWYRAYVNLLTAICILAVDFKVYPRRLAKTETFGTGLMDIFVGAFIMCNSLVCKEARDPSLEFSCAREKLSSVKKVLTSSLPLTILGVARLTVTKSSNYQGHVSEYGVHWNFFMTLAATRIICTLLLTLLKPSKALFLGLSFAATYQYLLSAGLQRYILRDGGRNESFVSANREGIFSLFGYMSLYFIGVTIGQVIFQQKRSSVSAHVRLGVVLLVISVGSLLAQMAAESYGMHTSRRVANLPFILWTVHHSLLVVAAMLAVAAVSRSLELMFTVNISSHKSEILESINYNGLLYFLLANLLTGGVNLLINTLQCSNAQALLVLATYLLALNTVIYIFYLFRIKTKFW